MGSNNSFVEHERRSIERINHWLDEGLLNKDDGRFHQIEWKPMEMKMDLGCGASFINTRIFLREMIEYGYNEAERFVA